MKPSIDQQLSTAIQIMKIDWQQPEENAGAFTTGLVYFDEIGPRYGYDAVRDWVEANEVQMMSLDWWSEYEMESFDEHVFIQGFWWAAQRWLKHVEDNCDCPCRFCLRDKASFSPDDEFFIFRAADRNSGHGLWG